MRFFYQQLEFFPIIVKNSTFKKFKKLKNFHYEQGLINERFQVLKTITRTNENVPFLHIMSCFFSNFTVVIVSVTYIGHIEISQISPFLRLKS